MIFAVASVISVVRRVFRSVTMPECFALAYRNAAEARLPCPG